MDNAAAIRMMAVAGLLLSLSVVGWREIKAQGADLMPVKYVRVEGAFQYIAKDTIKRLLGEQVMDGFYNADLQRIQTAVKALPWADKVEVQRIWPDALKVRISEHHPVARWGRRSLLNNQGELFVPDNVDEFEQLPMIIGPEGQQRKLLEVMKGLSVTLRDRSMNLKEFVVNERRAWKVILASGLEIKLGRKSPLENMQRFLRTVDLLGEQRVAMMTSVDLRYPNGYAVTWKKDAEEIDWKTVTTHKTNQA